MFCRFWKRFADANEYKNRSFFIETEGLSYTINEPSVQDEESVNRIKEELYEK